MSIDSNLIKKRIVEIEKKLKYIESENTKLELANDYFSLLEILKFIDFNSYNNIQTKEFHAEGKLLQKSSYDFSTDSFNSIMENFYSIVRAIACGAKTNVNIPKRIKKREIPFEIQNMYLKEFLNSFSKNILELYSNLENNIQISNDSKNSSNFKGFCWSQYNPSDNYIIVGNYAITPCLIHELGHAYDSRFCSNIEKLICMRKSSYTEAFPKFLELLFLNFMIEICSNKDYLESFTSIKSHLFADLKISCEISLDFIYNIIDYNPINNVIITNNNKKYIKSILDNVIATFISIYLVNLYEKSNNKYKNLIINLHNNLGMSDQSILELFDWYDIKQAYMEEVNKLNLQVKYYGRKRK